jgi:hypothetical protein
VSKSTNHSVVNERYLHPSINHSLSRFETIRTGGSPSLVGRGIAVSENENHENSAGSGTFASLGVPLRHFEPTRPIGHGISNPQSKR